MKNRDVIEKTFLIAWPYAIIFSIVTFIIARDFDVVLSFLLGYLTSMLLQSMNYRMMKSTFKSQPDKIRGRQLTLYFARFVFTALILYIAYDNKDYNVYLTLVGLLSFVIVSVPVTIYTYTRGEKNDEL